MDDKKNVLTIAVGKAVFITFALNLARSFLFWHKGSPVRFLSITDQPHLIPDDIKLKINIVAVEPGSLGDGFSSKLFLDRVAPEGQTLFIDSDCLVFGDLYTIFERFKGMPVSVVGGYISSGEWFGDIEKVCKQFSIPHLPKFNGGLYYMEKGDIATRVYNNARDLEKKYDELGFVRLRNKPNDEVIMALAMQLEGLRPLGDDGTILSDPLACPGEYKIDVIAGKRSLVNPPAPHPFHRSWYPFTNVSPLIVHFLGSYTSNYPYIRESYRLKKETSKKLNWFTELVALFRIEYPAKINEQLKNILRPLYRRIFGNRKIQISDRV